eukprot:scaffold2610_cov301-Prasinococcus_capsulatus_cf.AAC.3
MLWLRAKIILTLEKLNGQAVPGEKLQLLWGTCKEDANSWEVPPGAGGQLAVGENDGFDGARAAFTPSSSGASNVQTVEVRAPIDERSALAGRHLI